MNNWIRITFIAGVVLAGSVLASQAFADHFTGHVKGGANQAPVFVDQFPNCEFEGTEVDTICAGLGFPAFFVVEGIDPTPTAPVRCICTGQGFGVIDCRAQDLNTFPALCGGVPTTGGTSFTTTPTGPGSCKTVMGVIGGTVVSYEFCSNAF